MLSHLLRVRNASPLLSQLMPADLAELASICELHTFVAGDAVITQGSKAAYFAIVLSCVCP